METEAVDETTGVVDTTFLTKTSRETGAPPLGTSARLFCVAGHDVGKRFALDAARTIVIGRGSDAQITLGGEEVSRRHAEIRYRANRFAIVDLGSRNGTTVDGVPLVADQERVLEPGDRVQLGGGTTLVFGYHDELEDRARRLQELELVGAVIGGVVHDFKNTLTVILANIDMLRDSLAAAGVAMELRDMAGDIALAAQHGVESANRLLYFARRESRTEQRADIELAKMIDDVLALVRPPLTKAGIRLVANQPTGGMVNADPYELHHALLNLALNARDAMPEGGTLTMATRERVLSRSDALPLHLPGAGTYVEISVADTGIGMDDATRAHLFEPFFTTKPAGAGHGVGLSRVYGFARGHGGNILVESAPGRGTTFRLILPGA